MKRSSSVRLTLMSAVTAGSLAACGDSVTPGNYTDVGSCISAGNTSEICYAAQRSAYSTHETSAPRFANKDDCLKSVDVSDCVPARLRNADGTFSNMFVPAIAGFIVAQALQQRQQQAGGSSYGGGAFYASRDYPSQYRDGGNLTGSRTSVPSTGTSPSTIAPSRPPNISTTTIARSGFGSSSSFHGSSSS